MTTSDVFDDDELFRQVVARMDPAEVAHTLTKSPDWNDERAGDLTVFTPTDGDPVVYDPDQDAFLRRDAYRGTMHAARQAVADEEGLVEMVSQVEGAVEKRDVLMDFNDTRSRYESKYSAHDPIVETLGVAVDGEGYTLGRIDDSERRVDTYAVVRSTFTPTGIRRDVTGDRITLDRSEVPDRHDRFYRKRDFLADHLLAEYSDHPEQALELFARAYGREVSP